MNVAIVGSNGFIGQHLVNTLSKNKEVSLSLFGRSEIKSLQNRIPYHQINLMNSEQILDYFKEIDIVYYLATNSIPSSSWEDPLSEIEANLIPFVNFLVCISKLKVKKIIFSSSGGTVYGCSNMKLTEDSDKKPFSPHGINKITMEYYLNYFDLKFNLKYCILRISNVYGEGQDTSKGLGIINTFLEKIISEKEITVFGNGEIIRNYIYVKDVVDMMANFCNTEILTSNIYNLSSNDSLSINELIVKIKETTKEQFIINYKEARLSDNPRILLDNTKIKNDFKQLAFTPLSVGILNTYKNLIGHRNILFPY